MGLNDTPSADRVHIAFFGRRNAGKSSLLNAITQQNIAVNKMPRREGDPASLIADNKKAKDCLNWTPKNNLEYSIETAYNWENKLQTKVLK